VRDSLTGLLEDSPLLFGLASVFAGLATMLGIVAIVTREVVVLALALPFAATGYFMWYHASGRMKRRAARAAGADGGSRRRRRAAEGAAAGRGRFAREARERVNRERRRARAGAAAGGRRQRRERRRRPPERDGPSAEEAYRVLDLDPGASEDDVKRAYRERVKEVHPDTGDGDEDEFKRVTAAYERLTGD